MYSILYHSDLSLGPEEPSASAHPSYGSNMIFSL